ncbi:hypothetical protein E4U53_000288, partial [Claviceps sorghi]
MLLVALLAMMGAFRSEVSIYTGLDSIYINGTYDVLRPGACATPDFSVTVAGAQEISRYLELPNPDRLGNDSVLDSEGCLSRVSWRLAPFDLYRQMEPLEAHAMDWLHDYKMIILKDTGLIPQNSNRDAANGMLYWSEFGGTWEEHPLIHNNTTAAIEDFFRVYIEWANPFTFNNYHTRYDPHTYTMPIELRGSMLIYIFLLGTLGLKTIWRISLAGSISVYSLLMGRWDMSIFIGATMLSDIDIWTSPTSAAAIIDYRTHKSVSKLQ